MKIRLPIWFSAIVVSVSFWGSLLAIGQGIPWAVQVLGLDKGEPLTQRLGYLLLGTWAVIIIGFTAALWGRWNKH